MCTSTQVVDSQAVTVARRTVDWSNSVQRLVQRLPRYLWQLKWLDRMRLPQVIDSDVASTGKLWYHMQYTDGKPQPLKILSDNADCATQSLHGV